MEANYFTILYWYCHTSTWIHNGCTRVPNPEPLSHLPPLTIPLVHPSIPAPSILYPVSNLDWQFISYMILYNAILPNHPTLSLSHRVQKTTETCIISYMKWIASPGSMHDTGCLGLVHWDNQRDGTRREEGGVFRMGNTCIPVTDSCWCMTITIQYGKVINLQLK